MGAVFSRSERPKRQYYSRDQAILGIFITAFYCFLIIGGIVDAETTESRLFGVVLLVGLGTVWVRLILSRVEVFDWGIRVRNVFATFELPWEEIAGFGVGSSGLLLPYVCLVHLTNGDKKHAVGIQERTNFPVAQPRRWPRNSTPSWRSGRGRRRFRR